MPIYPNEVWPADTVIEALDGTTDQKTGLPYIPKGTGPTSVPSLEVQYNRRLHRLHGILAAWRQGMVVDEGDLKIGVYPIEFTRGSERLCFTGATGVSIPDNSAKVVYVDGNCNLQVADAWPADPTDYLALAAVTSTNGELIIEDHRPLAAFYIPSIEPSSVRDRRTVCAHCYSVGADQTDLEIFRFAPSEALVIDEVQVYCTAVVATVSVDVKEDGTSVLGAAATPVAGTVVKPTVSDPDVAPANDVTVHVTTGSGASVDGLTVTLVFKALLSE